MLARDIGLDLTPAMPVVTPPTGLPAVIPAAAEMPGIPTTAGMPVATAAPTAAAAVSSSSSSVRSMTTGSMSSSSFAPPSPAVGGVGPSVAAAQPSPSPPRRNPRLTHTMAMERVDRALGESERTARTIESKHARARMWDAWVRARTAMFHGLVIASLTALILLTVRPAFIYVRDDEFGVPRISMARVAALAASSFVVAGILLFRGR